MASMQPPDPCLMAILSKAKAHARIGHEELTHGALLDEMT
jgi:hypothetical protein